MSDILLDGYLKRISAQLDSVETVVETFEKTAYFLDSIKSDHVEQEEIVNLIEFLDKHELSTEPRMSLGVIERGIDSPLIFYRKSGLINLHSKFFKYARLVVQLSVIMAKTDRIVEKNEIESIKKAIWLQDGISERERIFLYAKAQYLLMIDGAYDEKYRDYIRVALSKKKTIEKVSEFSEKSRNGLIRVAMDVAISDGNLDSKELNFIKELYKSCGLSVRSAKGDVHRYAKDQYVSITSEDEKNIDMFEGDSFIEIEDVLGDLLLDFDEF